jgi:hypothetical protein
MNASRSLWRRRSALVPLVTTAIALVCASAMLPAFGCATGIVASDGIIEGGAGDDASCPGAQVSCSGTCVDIATSKSSCGSCGNACASGQVCSQGACSSTCGGGTVNCGGSCTTTGNDPANCGACGNACAGGQACVNGTCDAPCGQGQKKCPASDGGAAACTPTDTDRNNCGACGNACPSGYDCAAGQCALACDAGLRACAPDGGVAACVNTTNDPRNCGACGNACPASGYTCTSGTCQIVCPPPETACTGGDAGQYCTNLQTDPQHCGGCNNACGATMICTAGQCVLGGTCTVNLARQGATPSISSGGTIAPYVPANMNDGVGKTTCGFAWVNNSTTPSGAFIQYTWASPITVGSLYVETEPDTVCSPPQPSGRNIHSGTVQYWNGNAWVTSTTFSFPAGHGDVQVNLPQAVSTTELRIFDLTTDPGNGNSAIFEWHVYSGINCTPPP